MRVSVILMLAWFVLSPSVFSAEVITNAKPMVVELIDNQTGELVINDQKYYLRLNTKISDSNKRILNRYALKEGQFVKIKSSFEKKKYYADAIVIIAN